MMGYNGKVMDVCNLYGKTVTKDDLTKLQSTLSELNVSELLEVCDVLELFSIKQTTEGLVNTILTSVNRRIDSYFISKRGTPPVLKFF